MSDNDRLFLQTLQSISSDNREAIGKGRPAMALRISKSSLSKELLELFQVDSNANGKWFFNVYVEFEPLFRSVPAKDWQI